MHDFKVIFVYVSDFFSQGSEGKGLHVITKVWYGATKAIPSWRQGLVSLLEQFQAWLIESLALGWRDFSSCADSQPFFGFIVLQISFLLYHRMLEKYFCLSLKAWKTYDKGTNSKVTLAFLFEYLARQCNNWSIIGTFFRNSVPRGAFECNPMFLLLALNFKPCILEISLAITLDSEKENIPCLITPWCHCMQDGNYSYCTLLCFENLNR